MLVVLSFLQSVLERIRAIINMIKIHQISKTSGDIFSSDNLNYIYTQFYKLYINIYIYIYISVCVGYIVIHVCMYAYMHIPINDVFIDVFLVENPWEADPTFESPRRILSLGECRELELHDGDALGESEIFRINGGT